MGNWHCHQTISLLQYKMLSGSREQVSLLCCCAFWASGTDRVIWASSSFWQEGILSSGSYRVKKIEPGGKNLANREQIFTWYFPQTHCYLRLDHASWRRMGHMHKGWVPDWESLPSSCARDSPEHLCLWQILRNSPAYQRQKKKPCIQLKENEFFTRTQVAMWGLSWWVA